MPCTFQAPHARKEQVLLPIALAISNITLANLEGIINCLAETTFYSTIVNLWPGYLWVACHLKSDYLPVPLSHITKHQKKLSYSVYIFLLKVPIPYKYACILLVPNPQVFDKYASEYLDTWGTAHAAILQVQFFP